MVLPGCQDTGTAIVMGKRGQYVWTDGRDEEHFSRGVCKAYTETNLRRVGAGAGFLGRSGAAGVHAARLLCVRNRAEYVQAVWRFRMARAACVWPARAPRRYSQVAPQDMFVEKNTGTNLPAQVRAGARAGQHMP